MTYLTIMLRDGRNPFDAGRMASIGLQLSDYVVGYRLPRIEMTCDTIPELAVELVVETAKPDWAKVFPRSICCGDVLVDHITPWLYIYTSDVELFKREKLTTMLLSVWPKFSLVRLPDDKRLKDTKWAKT